MRNMSFSETTDAFRENRKDVTRRLGWKNLKPGEHFMAIEKGQGLKKGEKVVRLGECVCIMNTPEQVQDIICWPIRFGRKETEREGFPELDACQFAEMFLKMNNCTLDTPINRIEFRRG